MSTDHTKLSQRLQWLDAMRGFTMILVVMCHVLYISCDINYKTSVCQKFFILFRMPLFFFVSGFLAYKVKNIWTGNFFVSQIKKKFKVQIIPALIFFTLYIFAFCYDHLSNSFINSLNSPNKGGYWFTWVLLHMFCIYYMLEYLVEKFNRCRQIHINMNIVLFVVWLISLVGYVILYMPPLMRQLTDETTFFLKASSLIKTIEFFQFFLLGNIVHRNWDRVQNIIDSKWFYPLIILIAVLSTTEFLVWNNFRFMWRNLPRTIAIYCLLIILVCFFRNYERWFTKDTYIGRTMQYIGTRTLDIYLIHYFFLPHMPALGRWLNHIGNSFIFDFSISAALSLLIIAFSLIVSNILRVSPFLSECLFGRKLSPKN